MNPLRHLPNALTLGNLFLGCVAILFTWEGRLEMAAYLMLGAALLDFLDGFAARMLNAHSSIGKDLDSLADMVTFGVLPGMIMFRLLANARHTGSPATEQVIFVADPVLLIAFLITLFSALRLAIFNVSTDQSENFKGLATPANTIWIAGLPFLIEEQVLGMHGFLTEPLVLVLITILSAFLLVSPIHMFSLKFKSPGWSGNEVRYIFLIGSLCLILWLGVPAMSLIILWYTIVSITNNLIAK